MDTVSPLTPNDFPDNEDGTSSDADDRETSERKVISFDRLFRSLAETLPLITWAFSMQVLGKGDEQPSAKAQAQMADGWKVFFEATGVEYVGEGFNIKLRSPFWLALIPIVSTLAALVTDLGLDGLLSKKPAAGETT